MREITGDRDCIYIGHERDNESLKVNFNVQKFYDDCGTNGRFNLLHKRALDSEAYTIPNDRVSLDGILLSWIVKAEDLVRGEGLLQIEYYDGDMVLMSEMHKTVCEASLVSSLPPPDPDTPQYTGAYEVYPAFNDQVLYTRNKLMRDDVTVHEIPVVSTSNVHGGITVVIG